MMVGEGLLTVHKKSAVRYRAALFGSMGELPIRCRGQ